jgi:beta-glucosidase
VQVYAHLLDRDGVPRDEPAQRLVGFAKVSAPAGSSQRVTIALDPDGYRRWDVDASAWTVPSVRYELRVGRSSRDIVARVEVRA